MCGVIFGNILGVFFIRLGQISAITRIAHDNDKKI